MFIATAVDFFHRANGITRHKRSSALKTLFIERSFITNKVDFNDNGIEQFVNSKAEDSNS